MVQLVLDTSGPWCAARLQRFDATGVAMSDVERRERLERGHDQALAPMVRDLLADAGCVPTDVRRVTVCVGPGSFAGVRVGVAFARGFARALGVEACGASSIDAWARDPMTLAGAVEGGVTVGVHDARRGDVVWRAFRDGAPITGPVTEPIETARAGLLAISEGSAVSLAGGGAELLAGGALVDTGVRAVDLAILAAVAAADPQPARPFYHRAPDAKPAATRGAGSGTTGAVAQKDAKRRSAG